jgi:putative endonuclease
VPFWKRTPPEVAPGARGRRGEDLACRHLEAHGFQVLARNFRCRGGELDVVAREGGVTVFVEVKERGDTSRGGGLEAVTAAKRRRIVNAARVYASAHGLGESPLRFDVIAIEWRDGRPELRHEIGAFDTSD